MAEPVLPETPSLGDTGLLLAMGTLNAFHNDYITQDGSTRYLPTDLSHPPQEEINVTASRDLNDGDHGFILEVNATATLTVPTGLRAGFSCVVHSRTSGTVIVAPDVGVTFESYDPANPTVGLATSRTLAGIHAGCTVVQASNNFFHNATDRYWLEGSFV